MINCMRKCVQQAFGFSLVINAWVLLLFFFTITPAFERVDQRLEISKIYFVPDGFQDCLWALSERTNQCYNAFKTVCAISLCIWRIFCQRWPTFSLLFEHGALFWTSDGNASFRVYEYDNCNCLEKSVIYSLHSQAFFVVSCLKALMYVMGKDTRPANNLWQANT